MKKSQISKIILEGREFFVKRDDLIDPYLSGNKYRKLHTLLQTPSTKYNKLISYGGTQSNAMLAIAAMCKKKSWEFVYYTKPLSRVQKKEKEGNYTIALSLGMKHIELEHQIYKDFIPSLRLTSNEKTFILDQGGADKKAQDGLAVLANEIRESSLDIKSIATPSGTGTTALFLALALPEFSVYTTPCVGDSEYLRTQMQALSTIPKNLIILEHKEKHHFAKVYPEYLSMYKSLKEAGIEFDLLYAPLMWINLLTQTKEKILYIHSGGVKGNVSMLKRYETKGLTV